VDPNGGPGSAGLQRGDVILQVKRIRIKSVRQFKDLYGKAGEKVVLLVYRQGRTMFMLVSK
jgi:S1-C subfamily serine protease